MLPLVFKHDGIDGIVLFHKAVLVKRRQIPHIGMPVDDLKVVVGIQGGLLLALRRIKSAVFAACDVVIDRLKKPLHTRIAVLRVAVAQAEALGQAAHDGNRIGVGIMDPARGVPQHVRGDRRHLFGSKAPVRLGVEHEVGIVQLVVYLPVLYLGELGHQMIPCRIIVLQPENVVASGHHVAPQLSDSGHAVVKVMMVHADVDDARVLTRRQHRVHRFTGLLVHGLFIKHIRCAMDPMPDSTHAEVLHELHLRLDIVLRKGRPRVVALFQKIAQPV